MSLLANFFFSDFNTNVGYKNIDKKGESFMNYNTKFFPIPDSLLNYKSFAKKAGGYPKMLRTAVADKAELEALQDKVRPGHGLYELAGVLDSFTAQNGNTTYLVIDEEGNLRKITDLANGVRTETEVGVAPRRYVISKDRGQIFQTPCTIDNKPDLIQFQIPGLADFRYSEGCLGRPIDPSYDSMLTPDESNFIRDYIYGKHDDFEGVKKIWESKK